MGAYKIFFKQSVWKDFKSIPDRDLSRILDSIQSLGDNPRQPGCKKLSGQERYRFRQEQYRIIYAIQDEELTVWVVKVGHRKTEYR
ncbi:type II toxin-antitoxin system RelE/ParE family toxin [bacterium]|nr:type II toxin-antitoxin system RelE/ParE family toxin [bacterium]